MLDTAWQADTAWDTPKIRTAEMSESIAGCILSGVGATAPLRDSADEKVIDDFYNGTGEIINNIEYPDDYLVYSNPPPPADEDDDGYTNIEEYFHHLSISSFIKDIACMEAIFAPLPPKWKYIQTNNAL